MAEKRVEGAVPPETRGVTSASTSDVDSPVSTTGESPAASQHDHIAQLIVDRAKAETETDAMLKRALAAEKDRDGWKGQWEIFANAWSRELGNRRGKTHLIDELVCATRELREKREGYEKVMADRAEELRVRTMEADLDALNPKSPQPTPIPWPSDLNTLVGKRITTRGKADHHDSSQRGIVVSCVVERVDGGPDWLAVDGGSHGRGIRTSLRDLLSVSDAPPSEASKTTEGTDWLPEGMATPTEWLGGTRATVCWPQLRDRDNEWRSHCERLLRERDEAIAARSHSCSYCGSLICGKNDPCWLEKGRKHMEACNKHPLAAMTRERDEARQERDSANQQRDKFFGELTVLRGRKVEGGDAQS